ncbi:MAG: hypothetical protein H0U66_01990 [Gemmatimonadaceae bacterium]|nr:hypothetical protein [Gemmatimonadaceae bacterium]
MTSEKKDSPDVVVKPMVCPYCEGGGVVFTTTGRARFCRDCCGKGISCQEEAQDKRAEELRTSAPEQDRASVTQEALDNAFHAGVQHERDAACLNKGAAAIARMVALTEGYQALYAEACEVLEQQDDVPADVLRRICRGEGELQDRVNAKWPGDAGKLPDSSDAQEFAAWEKDANAFLEGIGFRDAVTIGSPDK